MAVDSAQYIGALDDAIPIGSEDISEGDDNIRQVKKAAQQSFPNVTAAVSATHTELNYTDVTPGTATASKAMVLDASKDITGVGTLSGTSLSGTTITGATVNGVALQQNGTAINSIYETITNVALKAPLASPTFTGTVTLPTSSPSVALEAASKGYVDGVVTTPLYDAIAILKDVKTASTGGGTPSGAAWNTRTLNDETDPSSFVTLSSNQFTLAAGTYHVVARAPAFDAGPHKLRLANITDTSYEYGDTCDADSTYQAQTTAHLDAIVTIAGTKTFELQHYIRFSVADGLGQDMGLSAGEETYAIVKIMRMS